MWEKKYSHTTSTVLVFDVLWIKQLKRRNHCLCVYKNCNRPVCLRDLLCFFYPDLGSTRRKQQSAVDVAARFINVPETKEKTVHHIQFLPLNVNLGVNVIVLELIEKPAIFTSCAYKSEFKNYNLWENYIKNKHS